MSIYVISTEVSGANEMEKSLYKSVKEIPRLRSE